MAYQEEITNSGIRIEVISSFVQDFGGTMAEIFEPSHQILFVNTDRLKVIHDTLGMLDLGGAILWDQLFNFLLKERI